MKAFFKGVRKHIGKLDAELLREQYALIADEAESLEKLINALDRGIIALDDNGRILTSNPAAEKLLGMTPECALDRLDIPLGKNAKREIAISYPEPRTLELQTIPMKSGTLVYLRDITADKVRTEEELRAGATKAVCDLAAGVAHEIGNPLNAIALSLQLLEREHPGEETITECRRQVARLDGILHGFLQALKPSRPNLTPGSLAEPVRNCLATLRNQIEERRLHVEIGMPAALPAIALDKTQMEQVFFNILKNAMEATRDHGRIDIMLASDDNEVSARIADTGEGMDAERLAHLFEPYRTSKAHGTGLGMMISARIVRDHGGTIDVESKPGEGTAFTVRLPRLERRIRALK